MNLWIPLFAVGSCLLILALLVNVVAWLLLSQTFSGAAFRNEAAARLKRYLAELPADEASAISRRGRSRVNWISESNNTEMTEWDMDLPWYFAGQLRVVFSKKYRRRSRVLRRGSFHRTLQSKCNEVGMQRIREQQLSLDALDQILMRTDNPSDVIVAFERALTRETMRLRDRAHALVVDPLSRKVMRSGIRASAGVGLIVTLLFAVYWFTEFASSSSASTFTDFKSAADTATYTTFGLATLAFVGRPTLPTFLALTRAVRGKSARFQVVGWIVFAAVLGVLVLELAPLRHYLRPALAMLEPHAGSTFTESGAVAAAVVSGLIAIAMVGGGFILWRRTPYSSSFAFLFSFVPLAILDISLIGRNATPADLWLLLDVPLVIVLSAVAAVHGAIREENLRFARRVALRPFTGRTPLILIPTIYVIGNVILVGIAFAICYTGLDSAYRMLVLEHSSSFIGTATITCFLSFALIAFLVFAYPAVALAMGIKLVVNRYRIDQETAFLENIESAEIAELKSDFVDESG